MKQILFLFLFAFILPTQANIHKYYVSISEIAYNTESQKVEVAIKVFFDDLQKAILVEQNEMINDPVADYESQISEYILNHFVIKNGDGKKLIFKNVGIEDEMDSIWLYFESNQVEFTNNWTVRNTIFVDVFDSQANLINFYADKFDMSVVEGLMLNSKQKEDQIHFKSLTSNK